jgi:hypothetical protein
MDDGFRGTTYRDVDSTLRTDISPFFLAYYMMDWSKLAQEPSETKCISCGGHMMSVEPVKDKKGLVYTGLVCHKCKTVLWTRKS